MRNAAYGKGCSAIAGATVNVGGATVTTDSNGRFSLTIPPGQVTANATAAGYLTSAQNVKLNDYFTNELDFFLTPTPPCPQSSVDPSVTICTPAANSTVTSPVNIVAGTNDSGSIVVNMFVWVDGIKQWTASGGSLNVSLPMASGQRHVSIQGKDAAGRYFRSVEVSVLAGLKPSGRIIAPHKVTCSLSAGVDARRHTFPLYGTLEEHVRIGKP